MAGSQQFTCLSLFFLHLGWLSAQLGMLPDRLLSGPVCSLPVLVLCTDLPAEGRRNSYLCQFLGNVQGWCSHNLCIFFLSKIWPGWIFFLVWCLFPLPELFICACCVLAHTVFCLLQLPVQVAAIGFSRFDVLFDWSRQPQLRAVSIQRGPSFFETNRGFLIKRLCFCAAEWLPGCEGECLHGGTPQEWVLAT